MTYEILKRLRSDNELVKRQLKTHTKNVHYNDGVLYVETLDPSKYYLEIRKDLIIERMNFSIVYPSYINEEEEIEKEILYPEFSESYSYISSWVSTTAEYRGLLVNMYSVDIRSKDSMVSYEIPFVSKAGAMKFQRLFIDNFIKN